MEQGNNEDVYGRAWTSLDEFAKSRVCVLGRGKLYWRPSRHGAYSDERLLAWVAASFEAVFVSSSDWMISTLIHIAEAKMPDTRFRECTEPELLKMRHEPNVP